MESILSLDFKKIGIRTIEFIPEAGFELPSFGFPGKDFLDADDSRRKQSEAVRTEESQPETKVALPSGLSLDNKFVPDGIGTLEQKAYYGNIVSTKPKVFVPLYLFFDVHTPHIVQYPNTNHQVQTNFGIPKSFLYAKGYSFIGDAAIYLADDPYESAAQSPKTYSNTANYLLAHLALFDPFDPRKKIYNDASLFVPRPKVLTGPAYAASPQVFPTNAKPLIFEQLKTVEFVAGFSELSNPYTPLTQPKPATRIYTEEVPKIHPQIEAKQIPKNSAALDEKVIRAHSQLQIMPTWQQVYDINQPSQPIIYVPSNLQQNQAHQTGFESRLRTFYNQVMQSYHQIRQKYQQLSSGIMTLYQFARNYYKNLNTFNFPLSDWIYPLKYFKKNDVTRSAEYQRRNKRPLMQIIGIYNGEKIKQQNKPKNDKNKKAETGNSAKNKVEKDNKQSYNPGKKIVYDNKHYNSQEENQESADNNENSPHKGSFPNTTYQGIKAVGSAAAYAGIALGTIAALSIFGLASVATKSVSLFEDKPKSVYERRHDKEIKETTIDAVVIPPKVKKFNQDFVKEFEPWAIGIENKIGIKIYFSTSNMEEGTYYERNSKIITPSASINKLPLAYVIASQIQKGLFDKNQLIPYIKELVLDREDEKENSKDEKGKISKYLTELNGVKYFKFEDLWKLMLRESNNTATNHLIYALMQEELQKLPQNKEEIRKRLDQSFAMLQNEMHLTGFKEIKIVSPYLDNEKLKTLGYPENAYRLNVTTATASRRFNEFILNAGELTPEFMRMLINPLETEGTTKYLQNILAGEYFWLKPGIDKHYMHMTGVVNGKSFTIMLSDFKNPLYEKADGKINLHRRLTPAGKAAIDAMGEYFAIMYNNFSNSGEKRTYKSPFEPTPK